MTKIHLYHVTIRLQNIYQYLFLIKLNFIKMVEIVKKSKFLLLLKMIEVIERSIRFEAELIFILNITINYTDSYYA